MNTTYHIPSLRKTITTTIAIMTGIAIIIANCITSFTMTQTVLGPLFQLPIMSCYVYTILPCMTLVHYKRSMYLIISSPATSLENLNLQKCTSGRQGGRQIYKQDRLNYVHEQFPGCNNHVPAMLQFQIHNNLVTTLTFLYDLDYPISQAGLLPGIKQNFSSRWSQLATIQKMQSSHAWVLYVLHACTYIQYQL